LEYDKNLDIGSDYKIVDIFVTDLEMNSYYEKFSEDEIKYFH
jgi:hypothetical protein